MDENTNWVLNGDLFFSNLLIHLLTYLLTPWKRVFLKKLTISQLVKKFPSFYGTRRFITAFISARHLSVSRFRSIHSMTPHPTSWRYILILSSPWVFQVASFPQVSPPKPCIYLSSPPYAIHALPISFFSISTPENLFSLAEFITQRDVSYEVTCTCSTIHVNCRDYIRQRPAGLNDKYCCLLRYPPDWKLEGPNSQFEPLAGIESQFLGCPACN